jgi:hypothetical protein
VRLFPEPATDRVDQYGRLLRYVVRVRDRLNVNVQLVRVGTAAPFLYRGRRGRFANLLARLALWAGDQARPVGTVPRHTLRADPRRQQRTALVGSAAMATDPPIKPRRIQYVRIALSRNTVDLPWASRAPLLERVRKHDAGLQVVLAFEAVGATLPVRLEPAGKRVLLQVVEAWFGQATMDGLPEGVWELRNELQNELADGELEDE